MSSGARRDGDHAVQTLCSSGRGRAFRSTGVHDAFLPDLQRRDWIFAAYKYRHSFFSLNEGLLVIRKKLGEERYAALKAMSDKMRALFEADPEDKTGDTHAGCMLIHEMEDVLRSVTNRAVP
jgi:hypothetical protein